MTRALVLTIVLAANGACTTFHLPQLYARGSYAPALAATAASEGRGELIAFDVGVRGDLGDVEGPPPLEEEREPARVPAFSRSAPCRVSSACAWERRAMAEARARVIGGAP
jgi:hypothetical protein